MPDLRQALKDFVATSNSGKYADEETLMSKFPELKGYDIQTLKDFVATSNSGKYADENELFSKFPEFNTGIVPSKKKIGSELTSQEADVESTSKPTQQNTSLGTNQQEEAQGSDTLDGLKPFDPLQGLIDSQQKTIKETTPAVTKQVQPTEEEDYFTGGFGNFLRGVDDIIPLGIGDFVDDMARGVASGYRQGKSAQSAGNLIVSGTNPSDEEITQFIESRKSAEEMKPSDEMNNYQKIYQEEGKGFWGVVKGLANNPSILPELLLSSLTSMATNTDAIKAGVATIIAGGSIGAATGATGGSVVVPVVGTGIGAGAGAIAGAEAAIPFAFGAASSVVEMGSTFGELLQEELGDKEMSKENVRAVLENPDKLQSIRNKAIARGLVIGTIDAFTGKLATGVGAKILTKSAAKSATGAVTRAATTKAVAAGAAVESLGGSFGETAARAAIGQDMDISEIALEGLAELPGGIRSTIQAKFAKPSYRVNGEKVTAEDIDELTRTMTPEQLYATKIVIKNDYEGRQFKIQDKIVTNSIKEDVRRANPELNEPSLNAITQLEKDLQGLEGNKTQTGKDKASAIRTQIKNIQENQLQDEAASEYIINEKQYSKENFLKELEGKTPDELKAMKIVVNNDEQTAVNINEKFKTDAIQEQSTTTIPVQSETTTSKTMETGVSESGPEVLTEEEVDIDLTLPKNKDNIVVADSSNGFILVDSDTNQPIEVFNDNAGENSGISKPYATQEEAQSRIEGLKQPPQEVVAEAPAEEKIDNRPVAERQAETESKIKNKNLFIGVGDFSKKLGNSDKAAVPISLGENNGIEIVKYAHPDTGSVDVIATGKTDNDFVGFYRIYENNKPTNKWSSKFENQSRNKEDFKTMISGVQKLLPEGHEYTEKTSISTDGLRVWKQQLDRGYELQYDEKGNILTNTVAINGDAIVNELGVDVNKGNFENIRITKEQFETVKKALLPYLENLGLNESNIRYSGEKVNILGVKASVQIDLPVLRKTKKDTAETTTETAPVETTAEAKSEKEQWEIDYERRKAKVDEFNAENRPSALEKEKVDLFERKNSDEKRKLQDEVFEAQQNISRADDADLAIEKYNKKKKELQDFDNESQNIQDQRDIDDFIYDEVDRKEKQGDRYEYSEEFNKDPREAALKSQKDLIDFLEERKADNDLEAIDRYKNNVKILEKDIKENPLKENTFLREVAAAETKTETAPVETAAEVAPEVKSIDAAIKTLQESKEYIEADDIQKEALVRAARKDFGLREKSAPSVAKLFGKIKDVTKITITEKAALVKQIRDLGRGAKEAVRAFKLASQQLSKDIKELKKSGKITSDQAANVIRAFSNVNVFSEKSVDRFTTYMTKVFEKADYANKINEAKKLRSKIKSLSKNKDKNANLRDLASKFGKIDPSIVADIDAYNELAAQIKNATDGSKIRGQKVNFAETVNIANATDYVNQEIKSQNKILKDERLAELKEIYGVDGFDFTDEEIKALLESDEDISNKDGEIVMATIKKAFNIYSTLIQNSIKNGVDAFTGEDVSFTKKEKETIAKFMSMDLSKIGNKNALQAVDALANFIENKSTAKMAATVATYVGDTNAEIIVKKGIYAMPLRKLFSPQFGAFLAEQTTTLPMVFEKMFKGFNRGGAVMDAMGLTKLINKKSFAERQSNNIVSDYVKEFYNKSSRPNGQAFNTAYNNTERGMSAFMLRNIIGTEAEMQAEFDRRKGLVEQSIKALSEGNNQQQKKAELYQKAYDKVVVNAKNLQDIKDNTDSKNLEAVDYWHKQWESKFDQLSDVASGIYNKVLDKDLNYSPDKYSKIKASKDVDLINNNESAFIGNSNGVLYNKKTGVLMDVTNLEKLPTSNKKITSYIDLSFDKNNSNSMYDALVDIETAEPIRQVQAFLNSDNYSKRIPDADNAEMLAKRIDTYVQNIRKKNPFSNDEFSKTINKLNKIATLGVGQALGGVTQPLKQVIPVALNTLINGQGLSIGASFDADFVSWLNGTGYALANRGIQSQSDIESLNALLEEAVNSKGQALLNKIQEANSFMLKWFLQKPDVFIAKASWKTYYEKSLKKQGIDPSDVDYKNHDVNEEAANYAQRMVDRQQNISDHDLAGNLFTDKTSKAQVLSKIFMPFAGFRMNQASRLATDLSVLGNFSVSTAEDKKIALLSLSSFATEMAAFKVISAGIGISMGYAAAAFMGKGEDEDEEEKRINNIIKGQATSAITDVVSPLPVFDKLLQTGAAAVFDGVQEGLDITEQDKLSLYSAKPQDYLKNLGLYGMAPDRIIEFGKLVTLATTGEYTDDFGKQKTISEEDMSALTTLIGPALLTNVGLAPSEVAGVVRNSIKLAKKKGETFEEKQEKQAKIDMFQEQLDKAVTPEDIDIATEALNRVKNPKLYEAEKETIKNMKESLLTNEETGITYDNISDVKKYDRPLWEKNFGPDSEWYQVTKGEREVKKLIKQKETEAEEEKFNYVKPKRKSKNSDGTYKKSSSSRSRVKGFGGSSSSSSSSTTERYDSRGIKITTKKSRSRVKGFN